MFEQKPVSQKMYLSGYGVELAIKSTEYKALDDTQVKSKFSLYTWVEWKFGDLHTLFLKNLVSTILGMLIWGWRI